MFSGLLRPGQGFKRFYVLSRDSGQSNTGRPYTAQLTEKGSFLGIVSQATPNEKEQFKQLGSPISHTITQRGTAGKAGATDVLELRTADGKTVRRFFVQGEPHDPGELGHFLVYKVLERNDL